MKRKNPNINRANGQTGNYRKRNQKHKNKINARERLVLRKHGCSYHGKGHRVNSELPRICVYYEV
jgi:hypothetical protein